MDGRCGQQAAIILHPPPFVMPERPALKRAATVPVKTRRASDEERSTRGEQSVRSVAWDKPEKSKNQVKAKDVAVERESGSAGGKVKFGLAETKSRKGEDYWSVCCDEDGAVTAVAFGVFDGHNGKEAARKCSEALCQGVLAQADPFAEASVVDVFWDADSSIGQQHAPGGSTATVLVVDDSADGGRRALFAFCGDSAGLVIDCDAKAVVYSTPIHTPQGEAEKLQRYTAVRAHIESGGFDTHKSETSEAQVREALAAVGDGGQPEEDEVALLMRALARGRLIATTDPRLSMVRRNTLGGAQEDRTSDSPPLPPASPLPRAPPVTTLRVSA